MRRLRSLSRRRAAGLLLVAALAVAAGLVTRATGAMSWLERGTIDARFALRGSLGPPRGIVLVGIDNETIARLPPEAETQFRIRELRFSRSYYARVLEALSEDDPRLIVFDISIDKESHNARADAQLVEAITKAAPVVLSTTEIKPDGKTLLADNEELAEIGASVGAAVLPSDGDGIVRRLPAQYRHLPTIAYQVADQLHIRVPVAGQHEPAWIDFRSPPGSVPSLSFLQVLHKHFNPAAVRGRIVVIGDTASVLQDQHATSVGTMSGPEVQAQAIGTALAGLPLRSSSGLVSVLLICLLGLALPVVAIRGATLATAIAAIVLLVAWSLATQLTFDQSRILDYSDPLVSLLAGTVGTLLLTLTVDSRERRRLRRMFAAGSGEFAAQVLGSRGHAALDPTAIISGYELEDAIGRGGMGIVYRATQLELGRTVALKLIASERSADPQTRERFKRESRLAASIDHANVIPIYEAGEDDSLLFIAMRLVDGVDLAALLGHEGRLEPQRALRITEQLAGALDAAHARGIVHRDVKPANVLLTLADPEHVYLTDFGVATSIGSDSSLTRAGGWVGTLDYLAPEQLRNAPSTSAVDVYALAGILHQSLTGLVPFAGDSDGAKVLAHMSEPPPKPSEIVPGLPPALDAVIARGLAKDPAERFPSAGDLARAAAVAMGLPSALAGPPSAPRAGGGSDLSDNPTRVPG